MKKIIAILSAILLSTSISLSCSACTDKIKDDLDIVIDENDQGEYNINLENIAFKFMYSLPRNLQPKLDRNKFDSWTWTKSADLKTIDGKVTGASVKSMSGCEYWEVNIKKNIKKGLYVTTCQESDYNPWDNKNY